MERSSWQVVILDGTVLLSRFPANRASFDDPPATEGTFDVATKQQFCDSEAVPQECGDAPRWPNRAARTHASTHRRHLGAHIALADPVSICGVPIVPKQKQRA